jgi:hypothetical protein
MPTTTDPHTPSLKKKRRKKRETVKGKKNIECTNEAFVDDGTDWILTWPRMVAR